EVLVAACDREILGKKFSHGRLQIEVNEKFYKGDLAGVEEVFSALEKASIANIVGNNIVERALEKSWVDKEKVIDIGGVKHAQIVCITKVK
ncbi:MAG: DUF424 family protein, partial [Candidatus Altiarchaeales archaeon]|nr:DUF424 family protein [Candidatus Altiarchaeales archaeon]